MTTSPPIERGVVPSRRAFVPFSERLCVAALALACFIAGTVLATHHPLFPRVMVASFVLWIALAWRYPMAWLVALPATLPLIDLAPWTGWLTFEEWDIVALGAAAGGYAAWSLRTAASSGSPGKGSNTPPGAEAPTASNGVNAWFLLFALFGGFGVLALYRGVEDAGGISFSWSQGYYDPLNSLRVFKGFIAAALMTPLLLIEMRRSAGRSMSLLALGLALGCTAASVCVLWERATFPGVFDFSADYRVTGPFWEMHVGGAALDGFLVLTLPFALWTVLGSDRLLQTAMGWVAVALGTYACLVTFSRGVYVAVPISLGLLALLLHRNAAASTWRRALAIAARKLLLMALAAGICFIVFRHGGYRALLAVLGVFVLTIALADVTGHAKGFDWALAGVIGAVSGAAVIALGSLAHKGIYFAYAGAFAIAAWLIFQAQQANDQRWSMPALAGLICLAALAGAVAFHWGGAPALPGTTGALLVLLSIAAWRRPEEVQSKAIRLREQALTIGAVVMIASVVAVFSAGSYMGNRFATGGSDLSARMSHWTDGVGMLHGASDWLVGKGFGRFPANYYFNVPKGLFPGSYALGGDADTSYLVLSGPRYPTSFGDIFRIAQRIDVIPGAYGIVVDARAAEGARLHLEICQKQLLYSDGCAIVEVPVIRSEKQWQRITASLDTRRFERGPWYAAKPAFFSMAVESSGRLIDIAHVSVIDPLGRDVVENGNFAAGMTYWFFTSDRYHLPWHIKNLALNVLFDQGLVGLILFVTLVGTALWRVSFGAASRNPVAPYLAAGLVGFVVVGAFDSLLDVPRVAFLFYLLLVSAATIPGAAAVRTSAHRAP